MFGPERRRQSLPVLRRPARKAARRVTARFRMRGLRNRDKNATARFAGTGPVARLAAQPGHVHACVRRQRRRAEEPQGAALHCAPVRQTAVTGPSVEERRLQMHGLVPANKPTPCGPSTPVRMHNDPPTRLSKDDSGTVLHDATGQLRVPFPGLRAAGRRAGFPAHGETCVPESLGEHDRSENEVQASRRQVVSRSSPTSGTVENR